MKISIIRQIKVWLGAVAVVCGMGLAFSPLANAQEMTAATPLRLTLLRIPLA